MSKKSGTTAGTDSKKKGGKTALVIVIVTLVVALLVAGGGYFLYTNHRLNVYNQAIEDVENGNYLEAIAAFESLGDYEDAEERIFDAKCKHVYSLLDDGHLYLAEKHAKEYGLWDYDDIGKKITYAKAEEAEEAGYFAQAEEYFNELGDYSDAKIRAMMASHYALKSEIWPSDTKKISKIEADFEKLLEHSDDDDRIKELLGDDLFHYVKLTGTWLNKNGKTAFILSIKKGHYSLEIWPSAPMKWSSKFPWWNMDGNEVFGLSDDNVKNPWFEILAWEPFDSIKPDRLLIKRATDDKEITLYRKGTPRK